MEDDLVRTEQELLRVVDADGDFLTEIASHLIKAGGKRVRPGFAMAAASVLDPDGVPASIEVIRGGCAVELVHIGSLYHDDVMDEQERLFNAAILDQATRVVVGGEDF